MKNITYRMPLLGRNERCCCGSGRRYKYCCGNLFSQKEAMNLKKCEKKIQFFVNDFRENKVRIVTYRGRWVTWHEFLVEYAILRFGKRWGRVQQERDEKGGALHPVFSWYKLSLNYLKAEERRQGKQSIYDAPMIGSVAAFLKLFDNLCIFETAVGMRNDIVNRLKDGDGFYGACYEIYAYSWLLKAGFSLVLEDERDGTRRHCEAVATHKVTGRKFSVEFKSRRPYKNHYDFFKQFKKAFSKPASYPRIIFIDMGTKENIELYSDSLITQLKMYEAQEFSDAPFPPAYLVFTNYPYEYALDAMEPRLSVFLTGFKMPDFKVHLDSNNETKIPSDFFHKHRDLCDLVTLMIEDQEIPYKF